MHESTQALRGKKLFLVGFTLFSMFFGAGNLIFPPFLGAQAGTALWLAFAGFAVSAIGLPIAGVAAVARAGGLPVLPNHALTHPHAKVRGWTIFGVRTLYFEKDTFSPKSNAVA